VTSTAYDLVVLGGGSGGIAAARRAAQQGARVALVEQGRLGGTCVNQGCVPKKVMWHAAQLAHTFEDAAGYGFDLQLKRHDWSGLKQARDAYITRLNGIYQHNLEKDGVEILRGLGSFRDARCVVVEKRVLMAKHVLIATGGRPAQPDVPGAELGTDSDGFFRLDHCPERVAVVGGGYIAVELAGMLQALGAQVTLLVRGKQLLRSFDDMLGEALLAAMRAQGIEVLMETQVTALASIAGGVRADLSSKSSANFTTLIWAIGRDPSTEGLGLDAIHVRTDKHGHVQTDAFQNSSVSGIYAVGDVTGRAALTPVAIAAGRRLADRLFGGKPDSKLDYAQIPTVVFSHPAIGTVGLSESEAREQHGDAVKVYTSRFNALYYGVLEHKIPSHMKLVTVGPEERVVGCHVIGQGSDELLQGFAVAMRMGATKRDFDDTIAIHPTSAEELVTMR
jgi:glutathione reductase (NADPH)